MPLHPSSVAEKLLEAIVDRRREIDLSPAIRKLATRVRTFIPSLVDKGIHDRAAQEPRQGIFWPRVLEPAVGAATEFVIWTGMKL